MSFGGVSVTSRHCGEACAIPGRGRPWFILPSVFACQLLDLYSVDHDTITQYSLYTSFRHTRAPQYASLFFFSVIFVQHTLRTQLHNGGATRRARYNERTVRRGVGGVHRIPQDCATWKAVRCLMSLVLNMYVPQCPGPPQDLPCVGASTVGCPFV